MSSNVNFNARNFTKNVFPPTKLFYIVFIDFVALLKMLPKLMKLM